MTEDRQRRLEAQVRDVLGGDTYVDVTFFPSGAVSLWIGRGEHFASVEGVRGEWGYSVDFPADEGFMGHDSVVGSLDGALAGVAERLTGAVADGGVRDGEPVHPKPSGDGHDH